MTEIYQNTSRCENLAKYKEMCNFFDDRDGVVGNAIRAQKYLEYSILAAGIIIPLTIIFYVKNLYMIANMGRIVSLFNIETMVYLIVPVLACVLFIYNAFYAADCLKAYGETLERYGNFDMLLYFLMVADSQVDITYSKKEKALYLKIDNKKIIFDF